MFAERTAHWISSLTQGKAEPVTGTAHPTPAFLARNAVGVRGAAPIGAHALGRFVRVRTGAHLPRATARVVAAGDRRTTDTAAGLCAETIAAATAIEADFVGKAATIVAGVAGVAVADGRVVAAGRGGQIRDLAVSRRRRRSNWHSTGPGTGPGRRRRRNSRSDRPDCTPRSDSGRRPGPGRKSSPLQVVQPALQRHFPLRQREPGQHFAP